jgi:hypothetical protein
MLLLLFFSHSCSMTLSCGEWKDVCGCSFGAHLCWASKDKRLRREKGYHYRCLTLFERVNCPPETIRDFVAYCFSFCWRPTEKKSGALILFVFTHRERWKNQTTFVTHHSITSSCDGSLIAVTWVVIFVPLSAYPCSRSSSCSSFDHEICRSSPPLFIICRVCLSFFAPGWQWDTRLWNNDCDCERDSRQIQICEPRFCMSCLIFSRISFWSSV